MRKMTEQVAPSPCDSCPVKAACGSAEHCERWVRWFGKRWDEIRGEIRTLAEAKQQRGDRHE